MPNAPSTITGTSVRRPMRAPHLGTGRSTKVVEGNTGRRKRQCEEDVVPRAAIGDGGWTVFQLPSTPGLVSSSNSGYKSQRKILKKFSPTEEEISKQSTKFQSHPRSVEGEIKLRISGGGVDGISNTVHPVSFYFSSLGAKPSLKNLRKFMEAGDAMENHCTRFETQARSHCWGTNTKPWC